MFVERNLCVFIERTAHINHILEKKLIIIFFATDEKLVCNLYMYVSAPVFLLALAHFAITIDMTNGSTTMEPFGPQSSLDDSDFITEMVTNCTSLALGICSMVANGIILSLAAANRSLRKDAKRIQIALSTADFIFGFGSVLLVLDKWRIQFCNDWYTAYYCISVGMVPMFGDALSLMFTFIMAIERLAAIWYPIRYRMADKRTLAYCLIWTAVSLVVIFCGVSIYGIDSSIKPLACSGSHTRIKPLKPMLSYYNFTVGSLVILVYCVILYGLLVKAKQKLGTFPTMLVHEKMLYSKEIYATKVVTLVVIGCITLLVAPNIIVTIVTWIRSDFQAGPYVSLLGLFHASMNFVLYMWKDKRMRQAFMNWIRRKKLSIVSNVTVSVTKQQSFQDSIFRTE